MNKKIISVIIPVYNEEKAIKDFFDKKLHNVLDSIEKYSFEVIFINDGSSDKTNEVIKKIVDENRAKSNIHISLISFSRNFGKEAALSAGFYYSNGSAAISIDSDGEHPPKVIPDMIRKWEEGADIVTGIRTQYTKHGLISRLGSKVFYKIALLLDNQYIKPNATDFRLLDGLVVKELNKLTEHNRITRGLIDWLGFSQVYINFKTSPRLAGKPSYTFKKLFNLAMDSFASMSTVPLMIISYFGLSITIGSFLLGLFVLIQQHIMGDPMHLQWNGAVQMAIFITFLVGLVLVAQAITALYISHIHTESKNRPLFIINSKESLNFKK